MPYLFHETGPAMSRTVRGRSRERLKIAVRRQAAKGRVVKKVSRRLNIQAHDIKTMIDNLGHR